MVSLPVWIEVDSSALKKTLKKCVFFALIVSTAFDTVKQGLSVTMWNSVGLLKIFLNWMTTEARDLIVNGPCGVGSVHTPTRGNV